jgi:hypothetical protein
MVQKHVAYAPWNKWEQINGDRPHFYDKKDILNLRVEQQKMGPVPIY